MYIIADDANISSIQIKRFYFALVLELIELFCLFWYMYIIIFSFFT